MSKLSPVRYADHAHSDFRLCSGKLAGANESCFVNPSLGMQPLSDYRPDSKPYLEEDVMGLAVATLNEIRLPQETPLQRAKSRHAEVISICEHLVAAMHAWGRLGKLCTMVERDKDYLLLGFESFGQWMMKIEEA